VAQARPQRVGHRRGLIGVDEHQMARAGTHDDFPAGSVDPGWTVGRYMFG
jgi:hypothetical protein